MRNYIASILAAFFWIPAPICGQNQSPPSPPDAPRQAREPSIETRDAVDARAPEDRAASALLQRTQQSLQRGDWGTAIQQLQSILNEPNDGLVRRGPGQFVSMRSAANALLSKMPRRWRERYVQQFGALARKSLDNALRAGDYSAVGDVATRYLQTEAGTDAARAIALRHIDRGEYAMALRWFEVLKGSQRELKTPLDRLQQAITQKLSGIKPSPLPDSIVVTNQTINTAQALNNLAPPDTIGNEQTDWPMLMGSAQRTSHATGRLPLLVDMWKQPLIQGENQRRNAQRIVDGMLDSYEGLVPAGLPLVVGNTVACRTAKSVSVFDVTTGNLKWRSADEVSTSTLFEKAQTSQSRYRSRGTTADENAQNFLVRNAVHGLLSSDGQQLFVIENQGLPSEAFAQSRFQNSRNIEQVQQHSTNVLAAYDLQTGALRWTIGGRDSAETFKPVLAGHYFHGVPAALGSELFVVTEKDNAIRLQVLDAGTGEPKWSQLLAFSDMRIERDVARRYYTAQVTVANGILLCPTTVDWLIAVDPLTRGILWARRHADIEKPKINTTRRFRQLPPMGTQWPASAPVVVGDRVVFTPPESTHIEGLELTTGKKVWQTEKRTMLYAAGVSKGNVIMVSRNGIQALRASSGRPAWIWATRNGNKPAGRGVLSDQHIHQPMTSGAIASVDLATGKLAHQTAALRTNRLMANLVIHGTGTLLQTPTSLEAYELRPPADAGEPRTAIAKLRVAEALFVDGKTDDAIAAAEKIDDAALNKHLQNRKRKLLQQALTLRVQNGDNDAATDIARLAAITTDAELLTRLQITSATASGNFANAFEQLLEVYRAEANPRMKIDDRFEVDRDLWLAGQLADTWNRMDAEARTRFDEKVQALAADKQDATRFLIAFAFHPAARDSLKKAMKTNLAQGRFNEAECILRTFRRLAPDEANTASLECASALAEAGQMADAASLLNEYGRGDEVASLNNGQTGPDKRAKWKSATWQTQRLANNGSGTASVQIPAYRSDVQFHRDYLCIANRTGSEVRRLHIYSLRDEKITWSLPLPKNLLQSVIPNGRSLLVVQSRKLSCISPTERRVLWEHQIKNNIVRPRQQFPTLDSVDQLRPMPSESSPVAIANEDYVCLREQRSIDIRDAVTGELRWTRTDIQATDTILGTTDTIFIRDNTGKQRAFRATDGHPLPSARIKDFTRTYTAIGQCVLTIEEPDQPNGTLQLQLYNPTTGQAAWSVDLAETTQFAMTGTREMVAAEGPDISIVNLVSGAMTNMDTGLKNDPKHRSLVVTTPEKLFLLTGRNTPVQREGEWNISGNLIACSRTTGKKLWNRPVTNCSLIESDFRSLPVFMITERARKVRVKFGEEEEEEEEEDEGNTLALNVRKLCLLDIDTGKQVAGETLASEFGWSHASRFEPGRNFIEVIVKYRRIRFIATQPQQPPAAQRTEEAATAEPSPDK